MHLTHPRQQVILARFLAFVFLCAGLCYQSAAIAASLQGPQVSSGDVSSFIKSSTAGVITVAFKNVDSAPLSVTVSPADLSSSQMLTANSDYVFLIDTRSTTLTLQYSYLSTLNLGGYTASVVFANGAVPFSFYVLEQNTILFVTQPETVTVDIGGSATFIVKVTGSSGYSYQWQRKSRTGWKNLSKATGSTLILQNVQGYLQGYHYRCKVSSLAGEAYSNEVRLFMNNVPATGDNAHLILYACSALLALGGMVGCLLFSCSQKKNHVEMY
ncbi:MAG: immunoglobulin domain-containing protein [Eubacteriales bacterium]|nr:immunoglobulin domain-containing protein [Eubacteriales bacterium]